MILQTSNRPSVLLAAGSGYANSLTISLGKSLQDTGRVSSALLLQAGETGRPSNGVDLNASFERVATLPTQTVRPHRLPEYAALLPRMAGALITECMRKCVTESDIPRITMRDALMSRFFASTVPNLVGANQIVNWQSADPELLTAFLSIPQSTKTVLSFWGSDLLRTSGTRAYTLQRAACERADCITVCSLEFSEILQAKYGRELAPKIRIALFGTSLLEQMDAVSGRRGEFRYKYRVKADDRIVCIGVNGSSSNRHLEIIKMLGELPQHHRDRILATVPMTYGCEAGYIEKVRQSAADAGIRVLVLDKVLDSEEMALLRLATDILIYAPVSDALSSSVSETFYAGGIVVTGAWLPYGPWRRCGLCFHEVEQIADITNRMATLLDNFPNEKSRAEQQAQRVECVSRWALVLESWIKIYEELATRKDIK